ncbi:Uncharacterised protein [Escherichia coli]|nr:Uncharacterised protein [Escherichia coli]
MAKLTDKQELFAREYLKDLMPRKQPSGRVTVRILPPYKDAKT